MDRDINVVSAIGLSLSAVRRNLWVMALWAWLIVLFAGANVLVQMEGRPLDTGLRKFGALVGDAAEVGCNAVLNPGSIIGRGAVIYPGVNWRGILPANMIVKNQAPQQIVVRRPT